MSWRNRRRPRRYDVVHLLEGLGLLVTEGLFELVGRQRFAQEEPLSEIAPRRTHVVELVLGVYDFGAAARAHMRTPSNGGIVAATGS
jgi:hypothetical protein